MTYNEENVAEEFRAFYAPTKFAPPNRKQKFNFCPICLKHNVVAKLKRIELYTFQCPKCKLTITPNQRKGGEI